MNKILIVNIFNGKNGQPSFERVNAFKSFYNKKVEVLEYEYPRITKDTIKLYRYVKNNNIDRVFISMPPFRNWLLFFLLRGIIILDIRDGWSIAMKTGYGGTVKPNKLKYLIARTVEKYAIRNSCKVITCTTGLMKYLNALSCKETLLITNGFSEDSKQIVEGLVRNKDTDKKVFVCAGKFSEYGKDKVVKLIDKIVAYTSDEIILKLIGCNYDNNKWIEDYIKEYSKVKVFFTKRMNKQEMYQEIMNSDYGLTIIRDPNYDFGTKVYDYILCDTPIFNYFDQENAFTEYFKGCFHNDYVKKNIESYSREFNILKEEKNIIQ